MSRTVRAVGLALAGLTVAALGLTACSGGAAEAPTGATPPATHKGEPAKPDHNRPADSATSGSSGQANSGFDGPAFQKLMAATSVPATSPTTGSLTTGAGTTSYTMTGNGSGIGRIDCSATAQGGSESQSDQDALGIADPFLETCGSYPQYGALKDQAAQYVRTNLPNLQGESKVSTTVGAIGLTVGRAGPGNYFVTIVDGG